MNRSFRGIKRSAERSSANEARREAAIAWSRGRPKIERPGGKNQTNTSATKWHHAAKPYDPEDLEYSKASSLPTKQPIDRGGAQHVVEGERGASDEAGRFLRRNAACRPSRPETPSAGNRLRHLRLRKGLSIGALAPRIGVSPWTLRNWELDRRKPSWHGVRSLALHLNVPVATIAQIVGLTPPPELRPSTWTPDSLRTVLRILRNWSGITQAELAAMCGCSWQTVRRWEAGKFAPSDRYRRELERIYRQDQDSILGAYPLTSRATSA